MEEKVLGISVDLSDAPPGEPPWRSIGWQRAKRAIAEAVAYCLCSILDGCRVYLLDLHGGEPSEGLGDKDMDLAVDCIDPPQAQQLEQELEHLVRRVLEKKLGGDPYSKLQVPNLVEVHSTREYLIERHVSAGPPYSILVCGG